MKSFYLTFALVVLCFFAMSVALAQFEDPVVVWEEDFEGYTQNSDLVAVYREFAISPGLSTEDSWSGVQAVKQDPGDGGRLLYDLNPVIDTSLDKLTASFYFYDSASATGRSALTVAQYTGGYFGGGSLEEMIAIGFHENSTYQYRVYPGASYPNFGWYSTGITRSEGWKKMEMVIYNGTALYYIDDALVGTLAYVNTIELNSVRLGPSSGSAGDTFFYDDILFETATSVGDWFLY